MRRLIGQIDKHGTQVREGDIIRFKCIYGFHSELMNEWKEMHNLPDINGIGSLMLGVVVIDLHRGLMLKRIDRDYAEPMFSRHQQMKVYHDWSTCEIIGTMENAYDRAFRLGQIPVGNTQPSVYLCGSCRSTEVTSEFPICASCTEKLNAAPPPFPWIGIGVMAFGLAVFITALIFLVKR